MIGDLVLIVTLSIASFLMCAVAVVLFVWVVRLITVGC